MKNLIYTLALLLLLVVQNNYKNSPMKSNREPNSDNSAPFSKFISKEGYKFTYNYNGQKLEIIKKDTDSISAYKSASKECFTYFTKGVYIDEETGLNIIDSCSNPK